MFALDDKEKKEKEHLDDTEESGKVLKEVSISNLIRNIFQE